MKKVIQKSKPATEPAASTYEHVKVPYAQIRPDPDQPRKSFSEASLKELSDSIREQGILQDLILEFVPALYRIIDPELHDKEYRVEELKDGFWYRAFGGKTKEACLGFAGTLNLEDYYRIVCGERRWRAAGLLGLKELPGKVYRNLTPQQRFAFQFIENNQRENITALEEAEALKTQLDQRKGVDPTFSPEKLAVELGMSRAGCYERLKLTRLHPQVRVALLDGKISTSVAGEIAKVPTTKGQEALLKEIDDALEYDGPMSVRDVQDAINRNYVKQLDDAPFDTKDENWMSAAVMEKGAWKLQGQSIPEGARPQACTSCPFRTGNMLAEFPELKSRPNVCTQPECFAGKVKAHWLEKAKDEIAKGKTVLTEKEFKAVKADYVRPDDSCSGLFDSKHWGETPQKMLGKHTPEPVLVATTDGLVKYLKRADIPAAAKKAKVQLSADKEETQTPEQRKKAEAKAKEQQIRSDRAKNYIESQIPELAKRLPKLKPAVAFKIAEMMLEDFGGYSGLSYNTDPIHNLRDPQSRVLARLLDDNANDPWNCHDWETPPVDAWKLAGIDLVAGFELAEKKADNTQQAALPLAKWKPQQGKLLDVRPTKKKPATKGKKK